MNILDLLVYCFNSVTGLSFELMSIEEISFQTSSFTYWIQVFDVRFIVSIVTYLSVFYFIWKVTYQLFFRLFMHVTHFPKKWRNK